VVGNSAINIETCASWSGGDERKLGAFEKNQGGGGTTSKAIFPTVDFPYKKILKFVRRTMPKP